MLLKKAAKMTEGQSITLRNTKQKRKPPFHQRSFFQNQLYLQREEGKKKKDKQTKKKEQTNKKTHLHLSF